MSFKRTLITLILFVVLLGVFYFDGKRREQKKEKEDAAVQVLQADAKTLDYLELTNENGQFVLERVSEEEAEEASWRLTKPVKTKADNAIMRSMIASLAGASKKNAFEMKGKEKLADYGLEDPSLSIKLQSSLKGTVATLSIGEPGAGYGNNYAALSTDDGEVFQIASSVKTALEKKLYDLRDKTVLACPADAVTSLTLRTRDGEFSAEKRGEVWSIKTPVADIGDNSSLGNLIRKVHGGRAADFIDTTGTLRMAIYGLDEPQATFSVWAEEFGAWRTLLIGDQQPEEDRYYAKVEGEDQVLIIPEDILEEINRPFGDFRTNDLFGRLNSTLDVASVQVYGAETLQLSKDADEIWSIDGEPETNLDQAKVDDLIAAYTDLRIEGTVNDSPTTTDTLNYGLSSPTMTIALANAEGTIHETVQIGRIDEDVRLIYARRLGQASVFELEWVAPEKLRKRRTDLIEQKLANFDTNNVVSIEAARMRDDGVKKYSFEKQEGLWKGRLGAEGDLKSAPPIEVNSFLNAVTDTRYMNRYEAGSQDDEVQLAAFLDLETTMTLKSSGGQTLLDVGVTAKQFDQRFARQPDGVSFRIASDEYIRLGQALETLLETLKEEE